MTAALEPLSADEIAAAVAAARGTGRIGEAARFATVALAEPAKGDDGSERRARLIIVPGPDADVVEAVVSVGSGEVRSWEAVEGMRPGLLFEEAFGEVPQSYTINANRRCGRTVAERRCGRTVAERRCGRMQ